MQCTQCEGEITPGKKFCKQCGAPITVISYTTGQPKASEAVPGTKYHPNKNIPMDINSSREYQLPSENSGDSGKSPKLPVSPMVLGIIGVTCLLLLAVSFTFFNQDTTQISAPSAPASIHQKKPTVVPSVPAQNHNLLESENQPGPSLSVNPNPITQPRQPDSVKEEIKHTLNETARMVREKNLDGYLSFYTNFQSPYYSRESHLLSDVRPAFEKMFTGNRFQDVQLSNFDIIPDSTGTSAVATFDKFFDFRGTKIKHGAVRHKVWLQKINGSWYITGQQDLQTYYVETQPNPDVPQSSSPENSSR